MTTPTATTAALGAALEAARLARDAALAAPIGDAFAIENEWMLRLSRIEDAPTLADKITAAERAEAAMRRRVMPAGSVRARRPAVSYTLELETFE